MSSIVYVVEMLRYGNREAHSYIDGIYSDRDIAEANAKLHMIYRAGKYEAEIHEMQIDGAKGRDTVCKIGEIYENEEDLESDIKSREDWLKYREIQSIEFHKKYGDKIE